MKYASLQMMVVFVATLPAIPANSEEWWQGNWRPEATKSCISDGGMLYKPAEYQAWEENCKIERQQKIKGIPNAIIIDLNSCYGEGEELPNKRQLLIRLNDGRLINDGKIFQKCSPDISTEQTLPSKNEAPSDQDKTLCAPEAAIFESTAQNLEQKTRQELKIDMGQAVLKEYREDKLAWTAIGGMSCTNGTWVCHLHFKNNLKNSSEEMESVAFDVVKDDAGNALALVAPGWEQDLYWLAERSENRDSGTYNGGLVVEWFNGFSPNPQKPNGIPASVFNKVTCPLNQAE
jgi:hypothetical protein